MINEEKVILMTKLASYEEREGKKAKKVTEFFRSDYAVVQIIKSIIAATIAFGIIFGIYIFMDFENFMANIYKMDLVSYARNVLSYYITSLAIYVAFTFVFAMIRYILARKSLQGYYKNLKKLNAFYKDHKN